MNCELDWSMQRRAHDRGRRLIASDCESIIGRETGIAPFFIYLVSEDKGP